MNTYRVSGIMVMPTAKRHAHGPESCPEPVVSVCALMSLPPCMGNNTRAKPRAQYCLILFLVSFMFEEFLYAKNKKHCFSTL